MTWPAEVFSALGVPADGSPLPRAARPGRFPDGADFRIEIPSVEGPQVLDAVLRAAGAEGITVNRVSQGSGAMLLRNRELRDMAQAGQDAGVEVCLFVGPRERYGVGAHARSDDGRAHGDQVRGLRQLRYAVEDVLRAVEAGIRSFLVADLGLLRTLAEAQRQDILPRSLVWKISASMAPSNPVTLTVLAELGASTINIPSDVTIAELAEMRAAVTVPLDLYVESPDALGGVVRGAELADLVQAGAPLYAKFGLRNARALYPSGLHIVGDACAIAAEKVHRAAAALEWLDRQAPDLRQSGPGAEGLGVPEAGAPAVAGDGGGQP
ncbi:MAG TPA: U32 family peptidase [Streptosporangiaceae bacterium]|nr:U32 family peptidase [Streptosporangiaceae bacterium]